MARLNVEDCWWTDPRRIKLLLKIGFVADSAAINMWRLAQDFWKHDRRLVPLHVFESLEFHQDLLGCGLASLGEDGVYVCGSSQYLDWMLDQKENSRKGGQTSAKRPRDSKGRLLKKEAEIIENTTNEPINSPSEVQVKSKWRPSESKYVQASSSSSSSSSSSNSSSSREKTTTPNHISNFEERFKSEEWIAALDKWKMGFPKFKNHIGQMKERFATVSDFEDWIASVCKADKYLKIKTSGNKADSDRYLIKALKEELGLK